jgi:hypothetical protein
MPREDIGGGGVQLRMTGCWVSCEKRDVDMYPAAIRQLIGIWIYDVSVAVTPDIFNTVDVKAAFE